MKNGLVAYAVLIISSWMRRMERDPSPGALSASDVYRFVAGGAVVEIYPQSSAFLKSGQNLCAGCKSEVKSRSFRIGEEADFGFTDQ